MNVTKARPSTLEAAIVPPAQPILLPEGIVSIPNCAGLEKTPALWSRSQPAAR